MHVDAHRAVTWRVTDTPLTLRITDVILYNLTKVIQKDTIMRLIALTTAATLPFATPALADPAANHLTMVEVFGHAALPIQLIMLLLVVSTLAAPVLLTLGQTAALSALARGAPLLAGAASLFTLLAGAVGIANSPEVPSLTVLAPGFAEMLLLLVLGLLATFSAVVCRELATERQRPLPSAD